MKLFFLSLLAVVISLSSLYAESPTAAESGAILNLSGRQRMLTQKMTKELMFVALGIEARENLVLAEKTVSLFDDTLYSLRDGNAKLGLPATTDARILRQIGIVDDLWKNYQVVVKRVIENKSVSAEDVGELAELNLPLLKQMNKCVSLYARQASRSAMKSNPSLAVAVNLSGRQRMLSQKMTKEMLLIAYGHEIEVNEFQLKGTYGLFDRTLQGLEKGDEELELSSEVNTQEILDQLSVVRGIWERYFPIVQSAAAGESISKERLKEVQGVNLNLLKEMNKAVGMYEALAGK